MIMECRCNGCGKTPSELSEYVDSAKIEGITPTEYVFKEEGTLNKTNGHFWCTACYIKEGCPIGKAR